MIENIKRYRDVTIYNGNENLTCHVCGCHADQELEMVDGSLRALCSKHFDPIRVEMILLL